MSYIVKHVLANNSEEISQIYVRKIRFLVTESNLQNSLARIRVRCFQNTSLVWAHDVWNFFWAIIHLGFHELSLYYQQRIPVTVTVKVMN